MKNLALETIQPWAPHPLAAPLAERDDGRFIIRANGTRTCVGGCMSGCIRVRMCVNMSVSV